MSTNIKTGLIPYLRPRINDTDATDYTWTSDELVEYVLSALDQLSMRGYGTYVATLANTVWTVTPVVTAKDRGLLVEIARLLVFDPKGISFRTEEIQYTEETPPGAYTTFEKIGQLVILAQSGNFGKFIVTQVDDGEIVIE